MTRNPRVRPRLLGAAAVLSAAALAAVLAPASAEAAAAAPAVTASIIHPDGGNGYVVDGTIYSQATLASSKIVTIYDAEVDFVCWIDGGSNGYGSDRWFEADYYGTYGYMPANAVSSPQPSLPSCA